MQAMTEVQILAIGIYINTRKMQHFTSLSSKWTCADPEGGTGGPDPPKKSPTCRVSSNTGPDPLKKLAAT